MATAKKKPAKKSLAARARDKLYEISDALNPTKSRAAEAGRRRLRDANDEYMEARKRKHSNDEDRALGRRR